jgi:hypothetical protein
MIPRWPKKHACQTRSVPVMPHVDQLQKISDRPHHNQKAAVGYLIELPANAAGDEPLDNFFLRRREKQAEHILGVNQCDGAQLAGAAVFRDRRRVDAVNFFQPLQHCVHALALLTRERCVQNFVCAAAARRTRGVFHSDGGVVSGGVHWSFFIQLFDHSFWSGRVWAIDQPAPTCRGPDR